ERAEEAHDADGRRGGEPTDPSEAPLVVAGEKADDEEVRREAGEEHAREVPVADEAGERERRAALAPRRIAERARQLVCEWCDRGDARDRERHARRRTSAARKSRPERSIAAASARAPSASTHDDDAKPENACATVVRPSTPHAPAIASATAKSGTGSKSHATPAPTRTRKMCQPFTPRPAGGAIHQSASGTATAASAPMTRDRIARFCGRASSVSGRASSSCGAPTRARWRRSSVSA